MKVTGRTLRGEAVSRERLAAEAIRSERVAQIIRRVRERA